MKGVIPTPDIAKMFHPTLDIKAKKCPTPTFKIHPDTRHPPSKRQKKYKKKLFRIYYIIIKYLTSTLDTDPPFKGPVICKLF